MSREPITQCPMCGHSRPADEVLMSWTGTCRSCGRLRLLVILSAVAIFATVFAGFAHSDARQDFQRYANTLSHKTVAAVVVTRKFGNKSQTGSSEVLIRAGNIKLYRVVLGDQPMMTHVWKDTIAHELCHLYVYDTLGYVSDKPHGARFKACARRVGARVTGHVD